MAKYVCDFDTIRSFVENINSEITIYESGVNQFNQGIVDNLDKWEGKTKETVISKKIATVSEMNFYNSELKRIVEYINNCVNAIETAEDELSKLTI